MTCPRTRYCAASDTAHTRVGFVLSSNVVCNNFDIILGSRGPSRPHSCSAAPPQPPHAPCDLCSTWCPGLVHLACRCADGMGVRSECRVEIWMSQAVRDVTYQGIDTIRPGDNGALCAATSTSFWAHSSPPFCTRCARPISRVPPCARRWMRSTVYVAPVMLTRVLVALAVQLVCVLLFLFGFGFGFGFGFVCFWHHVHLPRCHHGHQAVAGRLRPRAVGTTTAGGPVSTRATRTGSDRTTW